MNARALLNKTLALREVYDLLYKAKQLRQETDPGQAAVFLWYSRYSFRAKNKRRKPYLASFFCLYT